jgi:glycosyltransferase involved in cell wall biosynthesis
MTQEQLQLARDYLNMVHPKIETSSVTKRDIKTDGADLDVIIPCYNQEKYIRQCMDSVMNQKSDYSIRIIAVDDGSTDATGDILDEYGQNDNVLVIHQENAGLSGARNTGLDYSDARFVFFLDSDDMLVEGALDKILDAAVRSGADIVCGKTLHCDEEGGGIVDVQLSGELKKVDPFEIISYAWGMVYRAEIFSDVSFPLGYWFEDGVIPYLVIPRVRETYMLDLPVYIYRQNSSGISVSSLGKPRSIDAYWLREVFLDDMAKLGIEIDQTLYELLLDEIALTFVRTNRLDENVKVSIFFLTCEWFNKLHQRFSTTKKFQTVLEKGLELENYNTYKDGCAILWNSKIG